MTSGQFATWWYRCSRCGYRREVAGETPRKADRYARTLGWRVRHGYLVCPTCAKRSRLRDPDR